MDNLIDITDLRERIAACGKSEAEFARLIKMDKGNFSRLLNKKHIPIPRTRHIINNALKSLEKKKS